MPDQNEPCPAPGALIVFRGRTKRLFLCAEHRDRYTGGGRVCRYATDEDFAEDDRRGPAGSKEDPLFYGPLRVCGETVE